MKRLVQWIQRLLPFAPRGNAASVAPELSLEIARLEAQLAQLQAEREALERLASLGPGTLCGSVLESLNREFGTRLPEERWHRLEAWFRSGR